MLEQYFSIKRLRIIKLVHDILYFFLFTLILLDRYQSITMFRYNVDSVSFIMRQVNFVKDLLLYPCLAFFVFYILFFTIREKKITFSLGTAIVICCFFFLTFFFANYDEPLFFAILIFGAYGIPFDKIVKYYFVLSVILCTITFICGCTGIIENLVYLRNGHKRIAFGFIFPTDFCSHIFFLIVSWVWLRKEKITWCEIIGIDLIAIFVLCACIAKTTFITLILLSIWLIYVKIKDKKNKTLQMPRFVQNICIFSALFCAALIIVLSLLYNENNSFLRFINNILSTRLELSKIGFNDYSVSLFGQPVTMVGYGGSTDIREKYFFLDSSYINLLIRYGVFTFFGVLFIHTYSTVKELKKHNYTHVVLLVLICIQCFMEHHMMEIGHSPFLLYLLATSIPLLENSAQNKS